MLLKLEMPYIQRAIQSGSIIKWHKTEGDRVNYGDDLVDIRIEEFKTLQRVHKAQIVSRLTDKTIKQRSFVGTKKKILFMSITSSDMGVLRKIFVEPGARWEVGDTLAVLTTDENEPIDGADQIKAQVSVFRVVANTIETS